MPLELFQSLAREHEITVGETGRAAGDAPEAGPGDDSVGAGWVASRCM
jgi:hypothetical protein